MIFDESLSDWKSDIDFFCQTSHSVYIALFSLNGELVFANEAMSDLFKSEPCKSIINPSFPALCRLSPKSPLIFEGFITIGHETYGNKSIRGKVFRKKDRLLILGEIDVKQLTNQNEIMLTLNQEINDLQRQLIKEKHTLEVSLQQLKETQSMLIHAEKMSALGQLIAGVAHEINNPISFVYSNIYSLEETFSEIQKSDGTSSSSDFLFSEIEDMFKSSKEGLRRVKTIVEDLRKFSRTDESILKTTDLIIHLKSTLSLIAPELKKRHIALEIQAPETLFIGCFPSELNQVFLNLLMNSLQAIPEEGGKIEVMVTPFKNQVKIDIKDNGQGIPDAIKEKIFDPFFTTKPVGKGTGLGLSLAYKIITDLHKGTISFTSGPEGTIFTILIPNKQLM